MKTPWEEDRISPNGKPVKENFAAWFGRSGVVDAKGDPLPVHHGTDTVFDQFSYEMIGRNGRSEGAGFYFTSDKATAERYGPVQEFFLSIQKPMSYDQKAFTPAVMFKLIKRVAQMESECDGIELADGFLSNFGDVRTDGLDRVAREAARISCMEREALSQLGGLFGSGLGARHVNAATKEVTGFDGIVSNGFSNSGEAEQLIFVAFFPEQIKSARHNTGLYSTDDPCFSDRQAALSLTAAHRAAVIVESVSAPSRRQRSEP